jgi:hypothetical protein
MYLILNVMGHVSLSNANSVFIANFYSISNANSVPACTHTRVCVYIYIYTGFKVFDFHKVSFM